MMLSCWWGNPRWTMEIIIICCVVSDDYKKCYLIFPIYLTPNCADTETYIFHAMTVCHNTFRESPTLHNGWIQLKLSNSLIDTI